jgi:pimeloyl-ACP methyl ester carboxylesterase
MKRLTVRSGRADLAVLMAGEGPPLVFLHAGIADKRMWRGQLEAFAGTHTTIAYDRRGFGETTYEAEPHTRVGDLDAVLAALAPGRTVLVGCSQGGRVAIDYALDHFRRVRALVLVAPAVSGAPDPAAFPPEIQAPLDATEAAEKADDLDRLNALEAHAWLDGPRAKEGRVGGSLRTLFLDMNGRALRAPPTGDEISDTRAYQRFAELALPILLTCGDLDFPHIQERTRHLSRVAPYAELVEMRGAAHLPNLEQPDAFNALLRRFLADMSQP